MIVVGTWKIVIFSGLYKIERFILFIKSVQLQSILNQIGIG